MLPETTGIEFLRSIKEVPQVILVSSKPDYALEAFEHDVTDYILNPITYERFLKAAQKAKNIHEAVTGSDGKGNEFFVKIKQELVKIYLNEIQYVEAYGDYVKVISESGKFVFLSTMKSLETKLPKEDFLRVHKSFIVRLDKITKFDSHTAYINNQEVLVSRTYRDLLKSKLNTLQL